MTYIPDRRNQEVMGDGAGRQRSSVITTLFDGKTLGADDTNIWSNLSGGTGALSWADNYATMNVTTNNDYVIRRGRHVTPYFSGKSHMVEITMDNFHVQSNVTKRAGYYSSSAVAPHTATFDGFWFENDGSTIRFKVARAGTEVIDVPWTSWDAYSDISSYNWQNFTVLLVDFLWLGGTEFRIFIKDPVGGGFKLVHTEEWAGTAQDTVMRSPNHSVRYEIRSSGSAGTMRAICSQVASEGAVSEAGKAVSLYNASAITTNVVGTIYALKGVKKTGAFRDTAVRVSDIGVVNTTTTADSGLVMLILNPTLSAPLTYVSNSRISEGTATTQTVTAGTGRVLYAVPAGTAGAASTLQDNYLCNVGMNIADVSDEMVLAYMPATANQSVFGVMTVKEY
jgi:hypothetical protein